VGFEPTVPVRVQRFSRPSDSTTLAPLRKRSGVRDSLFSRLLSPRSEILEEPAHQSRTAFLQDPGNHFDRMVQRTVVAKAEPRFHRAEASVRGTVNKPFDPCVYKSPRAHDARFNGRINRASSQTVIAKFRRRLSKRQDLRVSGRIAVLDRRIRADREDLSIRSDDAGAHRNLSSSARFGGGPEGHFHIRFVCPGHLRGCCPVCRTKREYRLRGRACQGKPIPGNGVAGFRGHRFCAVK
jgi:hypothetical protein